MASGLRNTLITGVEKNKPVDYIDREVCEAMEAVKSSEARAYWESPKPSRLDDQLSIIVNGYIGMSPEQRNSLQEAIRDWLGAWLSVFATRMAVVGVRQKSEERLFEGLVAIAMGYGRVDYRDDLTALCMLWHSAKKLKLNPQKLFEKAAAYAEPETAVHLRNYRSYASNSLLWSGLREVMTPEGFDYGPRIVGWCVAIACSAVLALLVLLALLVVAVIRRCLGN